MWKGWWTVSLLEKRLEQDKIVRSYWATERNEQNDTERHTDRFRIKSWGSSTLERNRGCASGKEVPQGESKRLRILETVD